MFQISPRCHYNRKPGSLWRENFRTAVTLFSKILLNVTSSQWPSVKIWGGGGQSNGFSSSKNHMNAVEIITVKWYSMLMTFQRFFFIHKVHLQGAYEWVGSPYDWLINALLSFNRCSVGNRIRHHSWQAGRREALFSSKSHSVFSVSRSLCSFYKDLSFWVEACNRTMSITLLSCASCALHLITGDKIEIEDAFPYLHKRLHVG